MRETELYGPVKAFLESQGYEVKAEVEGADAVGVRPDDPDPVIVELKLSFNLTLVQQGITRQSLTPWVYLAIPTVKGRKTLSRHLGLCRRLGLGLLTVRLRDGVVTPHCDPETYTPRPVKARRGKLLREYARRVGDPNTGGSNRVALVTAYRQDALRLATHLFEQGASRGADVAKATGVPVATRMMREDHYGWFERLEKGIYGLTPKGAEALATYGSPNAAPAAASSSPSPSSSSSS